MGDKIATCRVCLLQYFLLLLIWLRVKLSTAKSVIRLSFRDEAQKGDCLGPEMIGQTTEGHKRDIVAGRDRSV